MSAALSHPARLTPPPPVPHTLDDIGLPTERVEQLIVKTLFAGELTGLEMAERMKVAYGIFEPLIARLRSEQIIEVRGASAASSSSYRYALTDLGRTRALQYLEINLYTGATPVPLAAYVAQMKALQASRGFIDRERLRKGFSHLVIGDEMLEKLGPAANANKAHLPLWTARQRQDGHRRRAGRTIGGDMYMPHAIDVDGHIITMFDPINHERLDADEPDTMSIIAAAPSDRRWVRIRRPVVMVGGELTLDQLDLTFNPLARFYEAPLQMRANGGVFLVDDFGRQRIRPDELLNRWIVPLESRVDFLTLHTGKKFEVPFDVLTVFATNLDPASLADEAFLRRIPYKIPVEDPSLEDFIRIFELNCRNREPGVPQGDDFVSSAPALQAAGTPASGLPSPGSAGPGDGALSLSRHRADNQSRAPRRGVRVVFRPQRAGANHAAAPPGAGGAPAVGGRPLGERAPRRGHRPCRTSPNEARRTRPRRLRRSKGSSYTVLLLDEAQLDRFLNRPSLKTLGSQLSRTVDVWPRGHRARIWATAAAVVVLAVTVVWLRAAGDPKAPVSAPARRIASGPPLATGASFSVNVTSFARDADARIMAGRLSKAGLPSFAWRLNGSFRDVLVGPFVSIDEAEAAQREVARLGYARTRLHVDERLRGSDDAPAAAAKASPAVVLVAAPGRLAVAFELAEEPQQVSGRRIDSTTFAVTTSAGPSIDAQEWNAPSDVQLVKHVSVVADPRGLQGLEAFVTVAENAVATVRLLGTRVYVDVSRAQLEFDEQPPAAPASSPSVPEPAPARATGPAPAPPALSTASPRPSAPAQAAPVSAVGPGVVAASPGDATQYRQAIGPVFARFEEIQPFLRSAVATPTPEVLAAVAGTFGELEQTLRATDVPRAAQGAHGLLLSAIQLARNAVSPTFTGDRMTQVREAMAQFQAAKAQLR